MSPAKKSVKKAGRKPVTGLVPQKRGGAIYQGPPANPVAGPGRPPSEVIARALGSFDERIPILEEIADNPNADDADRIRAVDKLGKYGLVDSVSRAEVRKALAATIAMLRDTMPPDEADALLAAIKPYWSAL